MICKKLRYNEVNQKSGLKPEKNQKNSKFKIKFLTLLFNDFSKIIFI